MEFTVSPGRAALRWIAAIYVAVYIGSRALIAVLDDDRDMSVQLAANVLSPAAGVVMSSGFTSDTAEYAGPQAGAGAGGAGAGGGMASPLQTQPLTGQFALASHFNSANPLLQPIQLAQPHVSTVPTDRGNDRVTAKREEGLPSWTPRLPIRQAGRSSISKKPAESKRAESPTAATESAKAEHELHVVEAVVVPSLSDSRSNQPSVKVERVTVSRLNPDRLSLDQHRIDQLTIDRLTVPRPTNPLELPRH